MSERRASPRHAVVLPALCARWDGTEFHAVTVDMSAEGLRLRSANLPRAEDALVCNIRGVGAVEARVAWAAGPNLDQAIPLLAAWSTSFRCRSSAA